MIWIILFTIIILISAVLAFRSMKDYEEFPESLSLNTLFFVSNPQSFTSDTLKKLHEALASRKQSFSIERLNKGKERALVIFGPRDMAELLPDLNLVEIEDYLMDANSLDVSSNDKTVSVNQTLTRLIEPKVNLKKSIVVSQEIQNLGLGEKQKFFIQVVGIPESESGSENFQSTIRLMMVDQDPMEKVALIKKIKNIWETSTGLNIREDGFPEQKKFESYKLRSLVPKEVAPFSLSGGDVVALIS